MKKKLLLNKSIAAFFWGTVQPKYSLEKGGRYLSLPFPREDLDGFNLSPPFIREDLGGLKQSSPFIRGDLDGFSTTYLQNY